MDGTDAASFLVASPDRLELLEHVGTDPGTPGELAADLPLSRRSVQRNLRAFVDRGWARKVDGEYRQTTAGRIVARTHAEYVDALDQLDRLRAFYEHLPDHDHAPEPTWLANADYATATGTDPHAPLEFYVSRIGELSTDRIRMLSPVLSRPIHRAHRPLVLEGVHTELVMDESTVGRARERNPREFDVVASVDVVDLYRHPGPVGMGLTLGDDRALVSAFDGDGNLRACVDASEERLVEWAGDRFEQYRREADPVPSPVDLPFRLGEG
jgi:predicted transcriptional regulator